MPHGILFKTVGIFREFYDIIMHFSVLMSVNSIMNLVEQRIIKPNHEFLLK